MKTSSELRLEIYLETIKLKKAERLVLTLVKKLNLKYNDRDIQKLRKARIMYNKIGDKIQQLNWLLTDTKVKESHVANKT